MKDDDGASSFEGLVEEAEATKRFDWLEVGTLHHVLSSLWFQGDLR